MRAFVDQFQTLLTGLAAVLAAVIAYFGALRAAHAQAAAAVGAASAQAAAAIEAANIQINELRQKEAEAERKRAVALINALILACSSLDVDSMVIVDEINGGALQDVTLSREERTVNAKYLFPTIPSIFSSSWENFALLSRELQRTLFVAHFSAQKIVEHFDHLLDAPPEQLSVDCSHLKVFAMQCSRHARDAGALLREELEALTRKDA